MNKTGFGFLRLPRTEQNTIDYAVLNPLVDRFLELGGNYFDTAYTYLNGLSEEAIRKSLAERHPRNSFMLADKLPGYRVKSYEECWEYFHRQQARCGVEWFDVYMLHWLNEENYAIAERYNEFSFLQQVKSQGKAKEIGFSFHDGPELLDRILTEHPEVDIVQLQINYLDWNSVTLQAKQLYEIAVQHKKKIIVMEPVKGGSLANLPYEAANQLKALRPNDSIASWAIRFAANLQDVAVVLSGMNAMEQVEDNMRCFSSLTEPEITALDTCAEIIRKNTAVPCTGCGYCLSHCPKGIPIPQFFHLYNDYARSPEENWKMQHAYNAIVKDHIAASECIGCGECERNCPQDINIPDLLKSVATAFQ